MAVKKAAPKKAAPKAAKTNNEDLENEIARLKEENKKLKSANKEEPEEKKTKTAKKGDKFVLQMIDHVNKPQNAFVKNIPLLQGMDKPKMRVAPGRHGAHEFTLEEAEEFITVPGQQHYKIVEA